MLEICAALCFVACGLYTLAKGLIMVEKYEREA